MRIDLPEKRGERFFMALACPFFALFLVMALAMVRFWEPRSILWRLAKLLIQEVLLAFTIVFVLAIIWALFTPRWVEKLANRYAGTVVFGSILLVFGGMAAFLIYEWIKAFG